MKKYWRYMALAISLALSISSIYGMFIIWWHPEEIRVSWFDQNLVSDSSLRPFFYTYHPLNDGVTPGADRNLQEWENYFDRQAQQKDISVILYDAQLTHLDKIYGLLKSHKKLFRDSLFNNELTQYFCRTNKLEALEYMILARKCEVLAKGVHYDE